MKEEQKRRQIKVNIPKEISDGIYSNVAFINFNNAEFVLDFARILPAISEAKIHARIVLTPPHCKRIMRLLEDNIKKYEEKYGEIAIPEQGESRKDIGF
ncbi:MAG: DUF3467 domain-containing protein [Candidatus Cloacimonadia bacterium]